MENYFKLKGFGCKKPTCYDQDIKDEAKIWLLSLYLLQFNFWCKSEMLPKASAKTMPSKESKTKGTPDLRLCFMSWILSVSRQKIKWIHTFRRQQVNDNKTVYNMADWYPRSVIPKTLLDFAKGHKPNKENSIGNQIN